jgi:uncharacterized Zn finger protein
MKCIYCSSENVTHRIVVCQQNEVGLIGLKYRKARIFYGAEQIYADLCMECGTIVRQYVEKTDRDWDVKKSE